MKLSSGALWGLLLAGCFLMIQGQSHPKDNREICLLPVDVGLCKAIIRSWYYDQNTHRCEEFDYGGCGGNANNFLSEEDCKQTCYRIKRVRPNCRLKSGKGKCGACQTRYFFNRNSMMCEKFNNRRCRRSTLANEFNSLSECLRTKENPVRK